MVDRLIDVSEAAMRYLSFDERDLDRLAKASRVLEENLDQIIHGVAGSLLSNTEAAEIVKRTGLSPEKAEMLFRKWYRMVLKGKYDKAHVISIYRIGLAHAKAGVPERLMIMNMGAFIRETIRVLTQGGFDAETTLSAVKAFMWNLTLMIQSYFEARVMSFSDATGLKPRLVERLIMTSAGEIYRRVTEKLETIQ